MNQEQIDSITMYLPKHHRGPLWIYSAAIWMFGLECKDKSVTKDKHRLHSTRTRSIHFGGILAREQELQINHEYPLKFRFEVTFFQAADPTGATGLVSSINMVWSCCNYEGERNQPTCQYILPHNQLLINKET